MLTTEGSKVSQCVIASILLLTGTCAGTCANAQTTSGCEGPPLIAAYKKGNWTEAISLSERCVAYQKTQSPAQSVYYLNAGEMRSLNIVTAFSHLLSLAQIHASLGHHQQAKAALNDANTWAQKYQFENDNSPLLNGAGYLKLTRGYLLESIKDRKGAAALYRQSNTEYAEARLALFAFEDGRLDDAMDLTQGPLLKESKNPLVFAVRGEVERSRGNLDAARNNYINALRGFDIGPNPVMAIFFLDRERILSGAASLGVKTSSGLNNSFDRRPDESGSFSQTRCNQG